jgi:type IV secretion system protein VirB5
VKHLPSLKATSLIVLLAASCSAAATVPVVDLAAIQQLIQEMMAWDQQLQSMRLQLGQLQQTKAALTGSRGMDQLLRITPAARNYLPTDWVGLAGVLQGGVAVDPALVQAARAQLTANAILDAADISRLPAGLQLLLGGEREAVAATQAVTRAAYARSSDRFATLATLIEQIRATPDAKAIAELQGRIEAEQAMLANEGLKLAALGQLTDAERGARELARRESAIRSHGGFASRFQPNPPVP